VINWVDAMCRELDQARSRTGHIGLVRRYLLGDHDIPYMPDDADGEFSTLAQQSITNYLPLISGTFGRLLYVDGYRSGRSASNADGWDVWVENKLAAKQAITMQGAIDYGTAYVAVEGTKIRPLNARKAWAWYEDDDADYPLAGLVETGIRIADNGDILTRYEFWHGSKVFTYERVTGRKLGVADDPGNPRDGAAAQFGKLELVGQPREHGKPFVPWVRFRDRLDDEAQGVVRPLIPLQNRVNAIVFYMLMALHYSSFRQRWGTGLVIPRDTQETLPNGEPNPNYGRPIEPFKAAVNRLWVSESADTKFGDFDQTMVEGHLAALENAVGTLLAVGRSSPLLGVGNKISNVAIESVAALNAPMNFQIEAFQENFGQSWNRVIELTGRGDPRATVRWRENEPRSFAQVVDGLVKLAQMGAPARGLFEMVPGITDVQLEQWNRLAQEPTETDRLAEALRRQAAPAASEVDDVPEAE
jgi:hypothetical protein